jgi:O-antigen ligase
MSAAVARIGDAFHLGPRITWLLCLSGLVGVTSAAALATRFGLMTLVLVAVGAAVVTAVSFRFPLLTLLLFAAFIPIEEVVLIDGLGTISRFAGILFAVTYGIPRLGRLSFGAMPRAGWAYVAWATLSFGWAIRPDTAWSELPTLLQLFLIGVLVADYVVQHPEIVRPVLWTYSLSAAATAVVGTQSYLAMGFADDRAVAITGQDPAQFAALLLPALFFGLSELISGPRRSLGGLVVFLTSLGIIVSGTRGAWFAVVAVLLLFVLPRFSAARRVGVIASIIVVLIVAYQIPGVAELLSDRASTALSTGGAGRADIWQVGLTIYRSSPLTGVGFANFPVAYTIDAVRAAGVAYPSAFVVGRGPHNLVIGTLVELGPIGLVLLAAFLAPLVLRRGWGPEARAVQMGLAALMGSALFLDILSNRKQVWLMIGIAAGLGVLARARGPRIARDASSAGDTSSAGEPRSPPP